MRGGVAAGAGLPGADSAVLLGASWRETRRAVLAAGGVTAFAFRQYMHATQARVLLRMGRHQEVHSPPPHPAAATQSPQSAQCSWGDTCTWCLIPRKKISAIT